MHLKDTYQLNYGQAFLPPQVFLHVRSDRDQHVVRVHEHMYERIQVTNEHCVTS